MSDYTLEARAKELGITAEELLFGVRLPMEHGEEWSVLDEPVQTAQPPVTSESPRPAADNSQPGSSSKN
jgi:hypothetical protein